MALESFFVCLFCFLKQKLVVSLGGTGFCSKLSSTVKELLFIRSSNRLCGGGNSGLLVFSYPLHTPHPLQHPHPNCEDRGFRFADLIQEREVCSAVQGKQKGNSSVPSYDVVWKKEGLRRDSFNGKPAHLLRLQIQKNFNFGFCPPSQFRVSVSQRADEWFGCRCS